MMQEADLSGIAFVRPPESSSRTVWWCLALFIFLFVFAFTPKASATIVVPLSEEALIEDAAAIVIGHAISIRGNYDQNRGIIFTNVTLAIEDVLKGEISAGEVTFRQPGGSFQGLHSWLVGSPSFRLGEKVLLFLRVDRKGHLRVAHLFQGKFTVFSDSTSGEEYAIRDTPPGVDIMRNAVSVGSQQSQHGEIHRLRDLTDRIRHHTRSGSHPGERQLPLTLAPDDAQDTTLGSIQEEFSLLGPARWFEPDDGSHVVMQINSAGEPLAPTNGFDQVRQAFQAWSGVAGSSFYYQDGGFTNAVGFQYDGVNAVSFRDPFGDMDPPVGCAGVLAQGGFHYSQATRVVNGVTFFRILDGDLVFNDGWAGCGVYENFANFAEVATHELGHVLGLDHSSDPTATMYYMAHFDGRGASLRQDDINGLRRIYPVPIPTLSAVPTSPQLLGASITFTAAASGGTPPYQYRWWVWNGTAWTMAKDWGVENTYSWTPTVAGRYQVGVWVKSNGVAGDNPKATMDLPYTITAPTVTLGATPPSPQVAGTPVTITATATGGFAPQQCKWWLTTNNWQTYSQLQDWRACSLPLAWAPGTAGSYQVGVWTRSNGSTTDAPEASAGLPYTITP